MRYPGQRGGFKHRGAVVAAVVAAASLAGPAAQGVPEHGPGSTTYPKTITMPNDGIPSGLGFQPEGIATVGDTAYVSSYTDGRVVRVDLRTGAVSPLVPPHEGNTLGIHVAGRLLLVAGQTSGEVRVYDRFTGGLLQTHRVAGAGLINDLTVAGGTAYATDSQRSVIYSFSVSVDGLGEPRTIPLQGDFKLVEDSEFGKAFNSNGVTALDEDTLLVAQTDSPDDPYGTRSAIYRVDVRTGHAERLTIRRGDVRGADGIEVRGSKLYVAQHSENTITEYKLTRNASSARLVRTWKDDDLAVPTNLAFSRDGSLYTVNSRFDVPSSAALDYEVVRVRR